MAKEFEEREIKEFKEILLRIKKGNKLSEFNNKERDKFYYLKEQYEKKEDIDIDIKILLAEMYYNRTVSYNSISLV